MEVIHIALSRLFHGEFLSLLKKTKDITTLHNPGNNASIASKATVVSGNIITLEKALAQDNGSLFTEAMQKQDHKRDEMVVGLREVISGHCKNPDDSFSKPAKLLLHIMDSYGIIASDNNDSESSKIDALNKDFLNSPENFTALNALGLKKWIDSLQLANNDYKNLAANRVDEAANDTISSFTSLHKQATHDFESLTKTINALAVVDGGNTFNNLINEMNAMLNEFEQKILIRKGIAAAASKKKIDGV